jgi:hypothetical protein
VIFWTDHAEERLKQRGREKLSSIIEQAIEIQRWEEWFEVDTREGRGLRCNLVVDAGGGVRAVARRNGDAVVIVSILTEQQYQFNVANLWSRTAREALHRPRNAPNKTRPMVPLTHRPFSKLKP